MFSAVLLLGPMENVLFIQESTFSKCSLVIIGGLRSFRICEF